MRVDSREAVAAEPSYAGPSDGGDFAVGGHFAHAMSTEFREIEIADGVHHHIAGGKQWGAGGGSAVAGRASNAVAGYGSDDAVGADAPHAVVVEIGHVDISRQIRGQPVGEVELGGGGGAAIAAESGHAGSRQGCDYAAGRDLTHAVVVGVGEVEVAPPVHGDALDGGDLGGGGRAAIAHIGASGHGFDAISRGRSGRAASGGGPRQG